MQPSSVWALKPLADMSAAEFHAWQTLLEERTGLVINEQRRAFLQTSLSARMRELDVIDPAVRAQHKANQALSAQSEEDLKRQQESLRILEANTPSVHD